MKRLILLATFLRGVSATATSRHGSTKGRTHNSANQTNRVRNGHLTADCRGTGAGRHLGFGPNKTSISSGCGTSPVLVPAEKSGRQVCQSR
jgi:hypothetical protein